jgi:hypothetical protein
MQGNSRRDEGHRRVSLAGVDSTGQWEIRMSEYEHKREAGPAACLIVFCTRSSLFFLFLLHATGLWASTLQVGSDKPYKTIRAAAAAAHDGDIVAIDSGVYAGDVATWRAKNLTVRGIGTSRPHLRADGVNESGKGIWVAQGANFVAENIEFSGATVPDQNGAGIRLESSGNVVIRNCYFHGNENGILGGGDTSTNVTVENSIFENNGYGDGYSHNIYIDYANSFTLRFSYSHKAKIGHNVKSRARYNYILYNRIMDEQTGTASYQVDLPEGGQAYLIGNIIQQGPQASNSTIIAFAAENNNAGTLQFFLVNNTIVNDRSAGQFVSLRSGTSARLVNNIFYGPGTPWTTGGVTIVQSNNYVEPDKKNTVRLAAPDQFDYHLLPDSPCVNAGIQPGTANGYSLSPVWEYGFDAMQLTRSVVGAIDVGAYEQSGSTQDPLTPPQNLRFVSY